MKPSIVFSLLAVLLFTSCDSNKIYEKYQSIPDVNWASDYPLTFEVDIKDTVSLCNILVSVRNSESYPFRNIFLEMKSEYPNQMSSIDTLEFYLMRADGKPLGNCTGDLCDIKYEVAKNQRFKQERVHRFTIRHIMRTVDGNLPLIVDIGLRIEKAEN